MDAVDDSRHVLSVVQVCRDGIKDLQTRSSIIIIYKRTICRNGSTRTTRKSPTFYVESHNWLSINGAFVQV